MPPTLPKGHTSILNPAFKYTPAVRTDLAATFARLREEREAAKALALAEHQPIQLRKAARGR